MIRDANATVPWKKDNAITGIKQTTVTGLVLARGAGFAGRKYKAEYSAHETVYRRVGIFSAKGEDWERVQGTTTATIM